MALLLLQLLVAFCSLNLRMHCGRAWLPVTKINSSVTQATSIQVFIRRSNRINFNTTSLKMGKFSEMPSARLAGRWGLSFLCSRLNICRQIPLGLSSSEVSGKLFAVDFTLPLHESLSSAALGPWWLWWHWEWVRIPFLTPVRLQVGTVLTVICTDDCACLFSPTKWGMIKFVSCLLAFTALWLETFVQDVHYRERADSSVTYFFFPISW
jgi:hypothetical protein